MIFQNQEEAAIALSELLPAEQLKSENVLLISLSLEGVIMCNKIAMSLDLDYELFFSAGISAPNNPSCEIACVSESEEIVLNEPLIKSFGITQDFIFGQAKRMYEEKILKQVYKYRKGNLLTELEGRNVLLINDGCESGAKLAVAAKSMNIIGANSIRLACALMPEDLNDYALNIFDEVYCAKKIASFVSTEFYFKEKLDNSEAGILKILEESPHYLPLQKQSIKEQPKE